MEVVKTLTLGAVVSAALVDSINPCALAVLTILLMTVLVSGKRYRVLLSGLAFTLTIYLSYFLMGLGLYSAIQISGLVSVIYYIVLVLALVLAALEIKAYVKYKPGLVSLEMPMKLRPIAQRLLRGVTSVPGAAAIGFAISLVLLPCSSGPYIIILGMLAKASTRMQAIGWLLLYNAIFVLPMILITLAVYWGKTTAERVKAWKDRNIRLLHLISGILLLLLAGILAYSMWAGII